MKLVSIPQDTKEAAELGSHAELLSTMMAVTSGPLLSRALQHALLRGVFETMSDGPKSSDDVAKACRLGKRAVRAMLEVFVASDFVEHDDGDRYRLSERGRKGLLGVGKRGSNMIDLSLMGVLEWEWHKRLENFVRKDETFSFHEELTPEQWKLYQNAMTKGADELIEKYVDATPVPAGARRLLDIGGGSGNKALAYLRRYPDLHADILDFPAAVEVCAPLLAVEAGKDNDRISWRGVDARTADLGEGTYDIIIAYSFLYALTEAENVDVLSRCARALRPGGLLVAGNGFEPTSPTDTVQYPRNQFHACMELLIVYVGRSHHWAPDVVVGWLKDAGLETLPTEMIVPNYGLFMARKPKT